MNTTHIPDDELMRLRARVAELEAFVSQVTNNAPKDEPNINDPNMIVYASRLYRLGLYAQYKLINKDTE